MRFTLFILFSFSTCLGYSQEKQTLHTPIIFVHGMLGSSDTWTNAYTNFRSAGYAKEDLWFLDWNTMAMDNPKAVKQLDSLVSHVIKTTGKSKVNLVGHSAGGDICTGLLEDKKQTKRVEKYIHLASIPLTKTPPVTTLNLYSPDDKITGGKDYDKVMNKSIPSLDHFQMATSKASFEAMYSFFNPDMNVLEHTTEMTATTDVLISGKACTLGDNLAEVNATIEVYSFNHRTGKRDSETPLYTFKTNQYGNWEAISLSTDKYYEFVVIPENKSKRKVHYYREPFKKDNPLVYLRTMPTSGFASFLLKGLPQNENEACVGIFSASKAIMNGRDNLAVQGLEVSRNDITPQSKTTIALFVYDDGSDQVSSGMAVATYKSFPFINAIDYHLPLDGYAIEFALNGRRMNVMPVKSSDGVMVIVFD